MQIELLVLNGHILYLADPNSGSFRHYDLGLANIILQERRVNY